ncbi:M48 family metallopeptidase [Sulfurihydrogenibium yellowstonense]|uniref:Zinc metalloprotease n=1 Tax=Sulfurihydrogenibium yellowstonense SS-5 TaxID=432331 RepID=C4FJB8_9AQUI|nr:SprT family zinc-dependent metalloprotease [Sulfurihydrogenibium yellowstonense]EEP60829.1 zinc metalloprotease [Sulfurihydrogenibium yellowstonense SS-5]
MKDIKIEKIIKSNRKTIAIKPTENGTIIVKAPKKATNKLIIEIIEQHKDKILKKLKELEKIKEINFKQFVAGEEFLYIGKAYKLYIVENLETPLKFQDGFYLSKDYKNQRREIFIDWYKKQAKIIIPNRVKYWAEKCGYSIKKVGITNANKQWGSCSAKGNLNFSWRLILAPLEVIDYVIVHKLSHLKELNHSKNFWNEFKKCMPEYKKHHDWLKNSFKLKF